MVSDLLFRHPADTLVFSSSAFVKRGSGNFHSIQWRIARVSFDINDLYLEVDAPGIWNVTQVAISNQPPPLQFPVWSVKPGNTYRVRCRHFDSNEWASEWSNPIEFVPKASTSALPKIIISEVMHSNTDWKGIVGDDLQYVELQNVGSTAADISRAKFDKDSEIEFEFPVGTVLQPQETIILTSDKFWFSQRYPSSCKVHKFKKSLGKKSGSKLILVDSSKRVIFDVSYMKKFPDFTGHSVITRPWGNTQVWSTSSGMSSSSRSINPPFPPVSLFSSHKGPKRLSVEEARSSPHVKSQNHGVYYFSFVGTNLYPPLQKRLFFFWSTQRGFYSLDFFFS